MTEKKQTNNQGKSKVTETDVLIGMKLLELRHRNKLSQEDIGEILGVSLQQVQKYEKGVNRMAHSRIITLCNYFGVEPSFFSDDKMLLSTKSAKRDKYFEQIQFLEDNRKDIAVLIKHFMNIKSKEEREKVLKIIKLLKGN